MPGTCGSVRPTVALGQQLANVFHVWFEMETRARTRLDKVLYDIESSTSALKYLQDAVDQDEAAAQGSTKAFTAAALQEIEAQALKCDLLFKAIILLVHKASKKKQSDSDDNDGGVETDRTKNGEKTDHEVDFLVGPVPDLGSPRTVGLVSEMDNDQWQWLGNRITLCQEQLRWVRKGLLVQMQIAKVTQLQVGTVDREDGSFDSELITRYTLYMLRSTQVKYIRKRARRQESAQRLRDLKAKRQEDDNVSIKSGSSHASSKTIVDENAPDVKSTAEKDCKPVVSVNGPPLAPPTPRPPMPIPPPAPTNTALESPTTGIMDKGNTNALKFDLKTHAEMAKGSKEIKPFKTVSSSLSSLSEKVSDAMGDWTHKIFGDDDEFTKDRESQELEAWVTRGTIHSEPMKVPFGHRRLQYALKLVNSHKADKLGLTTFGRYVAQGPRCQVIIDDVVREANKLQKRERVCLAFQSYKHVQGQLEGDDFTIVFFSICNDKAPVSLTDCIGRKLTIPFQICKTWEGMKSIIIEAFASTPEIGPHVIEGHYDLLNTKGETILNSLWDTSIKPGDSIKMMMWPKECHPLRRYYGSGPPYALSANQGARNDRLIRLNANLPRRPIGPRPPMMPGPGLGPMPMGQPRYPLAGPIGMPPGGARPPLFPAAQGPPAPPRPQQWPGGGVRIVDARPRVKVARSISTTSTLDDQKMTWEEEKQLTFVNYIEELEKTKGVTVADLLAKLTNLKDITGGQVMGDVEELHGARSSSDSETSSRTSYLNSTSSSIIDD